MAKKKNIRNHYSLYQSNRDTFRIEKHDVELTSVSSIVHSSASSEDGSEIISEVGTDVSHQSILGRVNDAVELLMEKRPDTRVKGLKIISNCFRSYVFQFDCHWSYSDTFAAGIEFILRKAKKVDQTFAVDCLTVVCLQSSQTIVSEWYERFFPLLDPISRDIRADYGYRAACLTSLAIFQYLSNNVDFVSPAQLSKNYETIFRASCLKGDGKSPVLDTPLVSLHNTALRAWGLVLCSLNDDALKGVESILPTLVSLLRTSNVDTRVAAAELTALVFEKLRNINDGYYRGQYFSIIKELIPQLVSDCTKSRSKLDRKKERHSFRDLLSSLHLNDEIQDQVSCGDEQIVLQGCAQLFVYNALCSILGNGIISHLRANIVVRDILGLGEPVSLDQKTDRRAAKDQRRKTLSLASKARTQKLNSLHDRKMNMLNTD